MDPVELARQLRAARQARGISQMFAAKCIGVPRSAITQIEAGRRSVSTIELAKLAQVYRRPVDSFLGAPAPDERPWVALQRATPALTEEPKLAAEVKTCLKLFQKGVELQDALGVERGYGPPARDVRVPGRSGVAVAQAEAAADEERLRLGAGLAPIRDIEGLIGSQGVWAAETPLPDDISGLFLRHPEIGFAILVNSTHANHRKRFSFSHEYAHALFDRDRTVSVSARNNASQLIEMRANAFAAAFLMPRHGVDKLLRTLERGVPSRQEEAIYDVSADHHVAVEIRSAAGPSRITYKDAATVAHHFDLSYEAAVYRLKSLRHIALAESERLLGQLDAGRRYLKFLATRGLTQSRLRAGTSERSGADQGRRRRLSRRNLREDIAHLAIEAFAYESITAGYLEDLNGLLGYDRDKLLAFAESLREDWHRWQSGGH